MLHYDILAPRSLILYRVGEGTCRQQGLYTIGTLRCTSKVSGAGIYRKLTFCVTRPAERGGVNLEFVDLVYLSSMSIMLLFGSALA